MRIIIAFLVGFNIYIDKKNIEYLKKYLNILYDINKKDKEKLQIFTKPVNTESINNIFLCFNNHIARHIIFFYISLVGLFCVLVILYDLNLPYLDLFNIRIIGFLFISGKLVFIIIKQFSNFSRLSLIIKNNNSVFNHLTGWIEKFSCLLGFIFGFFITFIYDILILMLQLVIFDMYLESIDSTKALNVKVKTKKLIEGTQEISYLSIVTLIGIWITFFLL